MKKIKLLLLIPFLLITVAFIKVDLFDGSMHLVNSPEEQYYGVDDFATVKKFDVHIHINTEETFFMEQAQDDNFQFLDIVDDRPFGLPMDEQQKIAMLHLKNFSKRMAVATTFSVKNWSDENWTENTIRALKKSFSDGAIAVKIWKNIGMDLRDENGKFVMVDNEQLDPILDYLAANKIPLLGHNGEPRDCWLPLEEMTFSQGYYGAHPEYHMYLHPEYPSYQNQIDARDQMLEKHPDLTFMGAHLGSLEWSLDELAKRLDKFPNMHVDLTRISNLKLHALNDRQKTRDFFIKYQDRLIYGTDRAINAATNPVAFKKNIHDRWLNEWKFYATDEMISLNKFGDFNGLKLPKEAVDKIYLQNALRILALQNWQ
jgi:predicted TIM-barrel fold metal-dependent hydrolase